MLRDVLLALLANEQPAHGYVLTKRYRDRLGVMLSIGNVYRELQRLVTGGLIMTVASQPGEDPRRTVYEVTDRGEQTLRAWLAAPISNGTREIGEEVTCRLAAVGDMEPEAAGTVLRGLLQQLWELAKKVESERSATATRGHSSGKLFLVRQTLLARQAMHIGADIEIVDELLAGLAVHGTTGDSGSKASPSPPRRAARARRSPSGEGSP